MADGSMDINQRGSHYFSIQICDKALLEKIHFALGSNHKISVRKGTSNTRDKYRLQIGSKEMFDDLINLGVTTNKTKNLQLPTVPRDYFGHFVRGYFDGDGNVWVGLVHKDRKRPLLAIQTVFTSCSGGFLKDLGKKLHDHGLVAGSFRFDENVYRLQYSIKDSIMLYRIMYSQNCRRLVLGRKRKVFEKYIQMRP